MSELDNEQQLLQDAFNQLPQEGNTNQPQKLKIGDMEVDPTDFEALQAAFTAKIDAQNKQIETLREAVSRPINLPPQQPPAQINERPKSRSNKMDLDSYAELLKNSPIAAHDEALARAWGLPEGISTFQLVNGMAEKLKSLEETLSKSQVDSRNEFIQREAERFRDAHPDYETTDENYAILQSYLTEYGLQPTAKGWDAAYKAAKHDGKLQGSSNDNTETVQNTTPTKRRMMPSLRNTGTNNSGFDMADLEAKLDKMPTEDAFAFINKLKRGQQ